MDFIGMDIYENRGAGVRYGLESSSGNRTLLEYGDEVRSSIFDQWKAVFDYGDGVIPMLIGEWGSLLTSDYSSILEEKVGDPHYGQAIQYRDGFGVPQWSGNPPTAYYNETARGYWIKESLDHISDRRENGGEKYEALKGLWYMAKYISSEGPNKDWGLWNEDRDLDYNPGTTGIQAIGDSTTPYSNAPADPRPTLAEAAAGGWKAGGGTSQTTNYAFRRWAESFGWHKYSGSSGYMFRGNANDLFDEMAP